MQTIQTIGRLEIYLKVYRFEVRAKGSPDGLSDLGAAFFIVPKTGWYRGFRG
jgi:hypothetical protein